MSDYNDVDAYIREHFQDGSTYSSSVEKNRDFKHPAYKQNDATGELFRHHVDQKIIRTIQSGVQFPNVRDVRNTHRMAAATKNADGSIESGAVSLDSPNGRRSEAAEGEGNQGEGPVIKKRPDGSMEVQVRRSSQIAPLPVKNEAQLTLAEQQQKELDQRLRARQTRLGLLPTKKKQ